MSEGATLLTQEIPDRSTTPVPLKRRRSLIALTSVLVAAVIGLSILATVTTMEADDLSASLAYAESQIADLETRLSEAATDTAAVSVAERMQTIGSWVSAEPTASADVPVAERMQTIGSWVSAEPTASADVPVAERMQTIGSWVSAEPTASADVPVAERMQTIGSWVSATPNTRDYLQSIGDWAYTPRSGE